jgi:hypothetical protein
MTTILPSLLLFDQFLKQQKHKGVDGVLPTGGSIIPLSVLLYGISILRKLYGAEQPKIGKGISATQVKDAIEIVRSAKIGSGLKLHYGGFIVTLAAILSAIGALAGIAKAVHDKQKNDAELSEMKRHNLVMEPNVIVGSSIRKRKTSQLTKNLTKFRL